MFHEDNALLFCRFSFTLRSDSVSEAPEEEATTTHNRDMVTMVQQGLPLSAIVVKGRHTRTRGGVRALGKGLLRNGDKRSYSG